mmetsp:Transcript_15718/g.17022  ORF Transcript_15718/g.17022 Transcript_15718/m.17022 type:complete len:417 (-) Transcript_15718:35-1285(-)
MTILELPESVLEYMRQFITRRPWSAFSSKDVLDVEYENNDFVGGWMMKQPMLERDKAWRDFMNTSKWFTSMKRKSIYLSLLHVAAFNYLNKREFYDKVNAVIVNKREQIGINTRRYNLLNSTPINLILTTNHWNGCNSVYLYDVSSPLDLLVLQDVKVLRLEKCSCHEIRVIRNLQNVEELELIGCAEVESIENLPRLTHLKVLECEDLDMTRFNDCPLLKYLHCDRDRGIHSTVLAQLEYLNFADLPLELMNASLFSYVLNIRDLTVNSIVIPRDLTGLVRLERVNFGEGCEFDERIILPPCVIKIIFCWKCCNINYEDLPLVRHLEFNGCSTLEDFNLTFAHPLKKLIFCQCLNLASITLLQKLGYLEVKQEFGNQFEPVLEEEENQSIQLYVDKQAKIKRMRIHALIVIKERA